MSDAVLPHHPESEGRSDRINEKLAMPDLSIGERMTPCDARFLSNGGEPFELDWEQRKAFGRKGPYDPDFRADGYWCEGRILASLEEAEGAIWYRNRKAELDSRLMSLDGKARFAMLFPRDEYHGRQPTRSGIVVDREIHRTDDGGRVSFRVGFFGDRQATAAELEWAKDALVVLGLADVIRLFNRRGAEGAGIELAYAIEDSGPQSERLLSRLGDIRDGKAGLLRYVHDPAIWPFETAIGPVTA